MGALCSWGSNISEVGETKSNGANSPGQSGYTVSINTKILLQISVLNLVQETLLRDGNVSHALNWGRFCAWRNRLSRSAGPPIPGCHAYKIHTVKLYFVYKIGVGRWSLLSVPFSFATRWSQH